MKRGTVPSIEELNTRYAVNRAGQQEAVRQTLYDFQTYALGGQTSLTFFAVPQGQSSKTLADTNLELAGSLPAPKRFLVESIEVYFYPGGEVNQAVPLAADFVDQDQITDDVYTVAQSGYLDFFIGSKSYLTEAPIGRFPPKTRLDVESAIGASGAGSVATVGGWVSQYASFSGRPYFLDPPIPLIPTQNFRVTLNWPAAVPLPSGANGRIGVVLDGILYRLSQ